MDTRDRLENLGTCAYSFNKFEVLEELGRLRDLPHNWNGYGAPPIDPKVIESAEHFLNSLPGDRITAPKVVPMTRGRLQFEWHRGNRSLELEFETPERIHYLKWDTDAGIEEEEILLIEETGRIHDLLEWFSASNLAHAHVYFIGEEKRRKKQAGKLAEMCRLVDVKKD